jgi:hypothetical protein
MARSSSHIALSSIMHRSRKNTMPNTEHIPDLTFNIAQNGSIELDQNVGDGEVVGVSLHPCHVRLLFERAGHLLPADRMSKMLARHLCQATITIAESGAFNHSEAMSDLYATLLAVRDMLPENVFPFNLYPDSGDDTPSTTPSKRVENAGAFELKPTPSN